CTFDDIHTIPTRRSSDLWIIVAKEGLRQIPDEGIGYGMLRYGGQADLQIEPAISFNFVGELKQFGGSELALMRLGAGHERSPQAGRRHVLAFDSWQEEGCLVLSCRHGAQHTTQTIKALLERFEQQLVILAQACASSATAVYTPSDFTGMEFSQDELDRLMGELG